MFIPLDSKRYFLTTSGLLEFITFSISVGTASRNGLEAIASSIATWSLAA